MQTLEQDGPTTLGHQGCEMKRTWGDLLLRRRHFISPDRPTPKNLFERLLDVE